MTNLHITVTADTIQRQFVERKRRTKRHTHPLTIYIYIQKSLLLLQLQLSQCDAVAHGCHGNPPFLGFPFTRTHARTHHITHYARAGQSGEKMT